MIANTVAFTTDKYAPLREISQEELRAWLTRATHPILAGIWRPFCILSSLTWKPLRRLRASLPGLPVVRVNLAEFELPEPDFGIRWLPATVLFADGRVRARWFSAAAPWGDVERLAHRALAECDAATAASQDEGRHLGGEHAPR